MAYILYFSVLIRNYTGQKKRVFWRILRSDWWNWTGVYVNRCTETDEQNLFEVNIKCKRKIARASATLLVSFPLWIHSSHESNTCISNFRRFFQRTLEKLYEFLNIMLWILIEILFYSISLWNCHFVEKPKLYTKTSNDIFKLKSNNLTRRRCVELYIFSHCSISLQYSIAMLDHWYKRKNTKSRRLLMLFFWKFSDTVSENWLKENLESINQNNQISWFKFMKGLKLTKNGILRYL